MNVLYCGDILQLFPSYSDFKDRRWILIAGCISNNFLTYTAIMLNIVTLYAVRKSSSVPKTLRTLMLSLAQLPADSYAVNQNRKFLNVFFKIIFIITCGGEKCLGWLNFLFEFQMIEKQYQII